MCVHECSYKALWMLPLHIVDVAFMECVTVRVDVTSHKWLSVLWPYHRVTVYLYTGPHQTSPHSRSLHHTSTTLEYNVHFYTHTGNTWSSLGPQWEQLQHTEQKSSHEKLLLYRKVLLTQQTNHEESNSDVLWICCLFNMCTQCIPHGLVVNTSCAASSSSPQLASSE